MFHFQKILIRTSINICDFFYNFEKKFLKILFVKMCANLFFTFKAKKNPSVLNLHDDKFNRFAVDSGYSPELVRICKSIKNNQWDPATKNWLLHKDYYYEFKQKIADKLKIELDLNEEEVMKRKVIVEELNKKYLVRSDVAVTDELKEILKPYLYCKYRNGWVIKNEQSEMFFHKISHIDYDFKPKRKLNKKIYFLSINFFLI